MKDHQFTIIKDIQEGSTNPLLLKLKSFTNKTGGYIYELEDRSGDTIKGISKSTYNVKEGDIVDITGYKLAKTKANVILMLNAMSKHSMPDNNAHQEEEEVKEKKPNIPPEMIIPKQKVPPKKIIKKEDAAQEYMPISHLTVTMSSFTIKGRIVDKSTRPYKNTRGEGKILKLEMADQQSSIEVTGFNDMAIKFENVVEKDQIYLLKNGSVKMANRKFSAVKNELCIMLDKTSEFTLCNEGEDESEFLSGSYNFTGLNELSKEENGTYDVICIIVNISAISEIDSKNSGERLKKRVITFTDESKISATGTLWGKTAEEEKFETNTVVAFKGIALKKFKGKVNFTINSNNITRSPNHKRFEELSSYLKTVKGNLINDEGSLEATIYSSIKGMKLASESSFSGDINAAYRITGCIHMVPIKKLYYLGCTSCKKRVNEEGAAFKCEKCDKIIDTPLTILMVSMFIVDESGSVFATLFHEKAEKLFKESGEVFKKLRDDKNELKIKEIIEHCLYKPYEFTIIPKKPTQGQDRISYSIISIKEDISYLDECKQMCKNFQTLPELLKQ